MVLYWILLNNLYIFRYLKPSTTFLNVCGIKNIFYETEQKVHVRQRSFKNQKLKMFTCASYCKKHNNIDFEVLSKKIERGMLFRYFKNPHKPQHSSSRRGR